MDGLVVLKTVASTKQGNSTAVLAASETVLVNGGVIVGAGDAPGQHAHELGRYVSSCEVERVASPGELRPETQLVTLEDTDAPRRANESGGSDGVGPAAGSAEVQRVEVVALPDAREVQSVAVEASSSLSVVLRRRQTTLRCCPRTTSTRTTSTRSSDKVPSGADGGHDDDDDDDFDDDGRRRRL